MNTLGLHIIINHTQLNVELIQLYIYIKEKKLSYSKQGNTSRFNFGITRNTTAKKAGSNLFSISTRATDESAVFCWYYSVEYDDSRSPGSSYIS